MPTWLLALGGLLVWTAHFFGCYLIASVWVASVTANAIALVFTAACLAVDGWLLWRTFPAVGGKDGDDVDRWFGTIAFLGAALSGLSVLWQGLPALFV